MEIQAHLDNRCREHPAQMADKSHVPDECRPGRGGAHVTHGDGLHRPLRRHSRLQDPGMKRPHRRPPARGAFRKHGHGPPATQGGRDGGIGVHQASPVATGNEHGSAGSRQETQQGPAPHSSLGHETHRHHGTQGQDVEPGNVVGHIQRVCLGSAPALHLEPHDGRATTQPAADGRLPARGIEPGRPQQQPPNRCLHQSRGDMSRQEQGAPGQAQHRPPPFQAPRRWTKRRR